MTVHRKDEFEVLSLLSSIKHALSSAGWTRRKAQQKAKEQNLKKRASSIV